VIFNHADLFLASCYSGLAVNDGDCCCSWKSLVDYIDLRYEEYMNAESRVNRRVVPDTRVHCCLYFISPNGHGYCSQFEVFFNIFFKIRSVFKVFVFVLFILSPMK